MMVDFEKRCSYLEAELNRITSAYDIINSEHSMMLEELGFSKEIKPTRVLIKTAILLRSDAVHATDDGGKKWK